MVCAGAKQIGDGIDWCALAPDVFVAAAFADVSWGPHRAIADFARDGGRLVGTDEEQALQYQALEGAQRPVAALQRVQRCPCSILDLHVEPRAELVADRSGVLTARTTRNVGSIVIGVDTGHAPDRLQVAAAAAAVLRERGVALLGWSDASHDLQRRAADERPQRDVSFARESICIATVRAAVEGLLRRQEIGDGLRPHPQQAGDAAHPRQRRRQRHERQPCNLPCRSKSIHQTLSATCAGTLRTGAIRTDRQDGNVRVAPRLSGSRSKEIGRAHV